MRIRRTIAAVGLLMLALFSAPACTTADSDASALSPIAGPPAVWQMQFSDSESCIEARKKVRFLHGVARRLCEQSQNGIVDPRVFYSDRECYKRQDEINRKEKKNWSPIGINRYCLDTQNEKIPRVEWVR